ERLAEVAPTSQGKVIVLAVEGHGPLALEHLTHERDELSRARQRLGKGLTVPPLHHLGTRDTDAEEEAPVRKMVDRSGGHGNACRRTCRELHHAGTKFDSRGLR